MTAAQVTSSFLGVNWEGDRGRMEAAASRSNLPQYRDARVQDLKYFH